MKEILSFTQNDKEMRNQVKYNKSNLIVYEFFPSGKIKKGF